MAESISPTLQRAESLGRGTKELPHSGASGICSNGAISPIIGVSWRDRIEENRACVPEGLQDNPSLRPQLPTLLLECYPRARRKAARQTRLSLLTFPDTCPWTVEQILDETFWPEAAVTLEDKE
jgi:hypothetical protein